MVVLSTTKNALQGLPRPSTPAHWSIKEGKEAMVQEMFLQGGRQEDKEGSQLGLQFKGGVLRSLAQVVVQRGQGCRAGAN